MDNEYILKRLKKWAKLFHSDKKKHVAFKKGKFYCFGYETKDDLIVSILTKPVALYMVTGKQPENEKGKKSKKKKVRRKRKDI